MKYKRSNLIPKVFPDFWRAEEMNHARDEVGVRVSGALPSAGHMPEGWVDCPGTQM